MTANLSRSSECGHTRNKTGEPPLAENRRIRPLKRHVRGLNTKGIHRALYNWPVKHSSRNPDKNEELKADRSIAFEEIVFYIDHGNEVDVCDHPNQKRDPGQKISVVVVDDYAYLVPHVESETEVFLKTILPSLKTTKKYLGKSPMPKRDKEEREILEACERGELKSIPTKTAE